MVAPLEQDERVGSTAFTSTAKSHNEQGSANSILTGRDVPRSESESREIAAVRDPSTTPLLALAAFLALYSPNSSYPRSSLDGVRTSPPPESLPSRVFSLRSGVISRPNGEGKDITRRTVPTSLFLNVDVSLPYRQRAGVPKENGNCYDRRRPLLSTYVNMPLNRAISVRS